MCPHDGVCWVFTANTAMALPRYVALYTESLQGELVATAEAELHQLFDGMRACDLAALRVEAERSL